MDDFALCFKNSQPPHLHPIYPDIVRPWPSNLIGIVRIPDFINVSGKLARRISRKCNLMFLAFQYFPNNFTVILCSCMLKNVLDEDKQGFFMSSDNVLMKHSSLMNCQNTPVLIFSIDRLGILGVSALLIILWSTQIIQLCLWYCNNSMTLFMYVAIFCLIETASHKLALWGRTYFKLHFELSMNSRHWFES